MTLNRRLLQWGKMVKSSVSGLAERCRTPSYVVFSLAVVSLIALFAWVRWGEVGRYPGIQFFELAAQTFPIILVALAVEGNARQFFKAHRFGRQIRWTAIAFLAGGELSAVTVAAGLYELDVGSVVTDLFVAFTSLGLLGGFLVVLLVALLDPPPE